jgi:hypothetical protein
MKIKSERYLGVIRKKAKKLLINFRNKAKVFSSVALREREHSQPQVHYNITY